MIDEKFLQYINSGVDAIIVQQKPINDIHGPSINTTQAYNGLSKLEYFTLHIFSSKNISGLEAVNAAKYLLAEIYAEQLNNQPKPQDNAINLL
jgi:hypothetical protein